MPSQGSIGHWLSSIFYILHNEELVKCVVNNRHTQLAFDGSTGLAREHCNEPQADTS